MTARNDVIVGATLLEARYWKGHFSRQIPELAEAVEVSAHYQDSVLGLNVRNIYIAPGAQEGKDFPEVLEALKMRQFTAGDVREPIILSSKGAL